VSEHAPPRERRAAPVAPFHVGCLIAPGTARIALALQQES